MPRENCYLVHRVIETIAHVDWPIEGDFGAVYNVRSLIN